eukprot:817917-Rhodomonas_salina.1
MPREDRQETTSWSIRGSTSGSLFCLLTRYSKRCRYVFPSKLSGTATVPGSANSTAVQAVSTTHHLACEKTVPVH